MNDYFIVCQFQSFGLKSDTLPTPLSPTPKHNRLCNDVMKIRRWQIADFDRARTASHQSDPFDLPRYRKRMVESSALFDETRYFKSFAPSERANDVPSRRARANWVCHRRLLQHDSAKRFCIRKPNVVSCPSFFLYSPIRRHGWNEAYHPSHDRIGLSTPLDSNYRDEVLSVLRPCPVVDHGKRISNYKSQAY